MVGIDEKIREALEKAKNGNQSQVGSIQPYLVAVLSAAVGALATWSMKVEDRVYQLTLAQRGNASIELVERLNARADAEHGKMMERIRILELELKEKAKGMQ